MLPFPMFPELLMQVRRGPAEAAAGAEAFALGLNLISLGLLLGLLVVFFGTWRKTRAPFSLGLVIFVAVLIIGNVARAGRIFRIGPSPLLVAGPEFLEVVALVILLYLATR